MTDDYSPMAGSGPLPGHLDLSDVVPGEPAHAAHPAG